MRYARLCGSLSPSSRGMVRSFFFGVCLVGGLFQVAHAQDAERWFGDAHLDMQVEVLPAALRITVASSQLDFAQQRPHIGHVLLDPVTGEISTKVAGAHSVGEVRLTGPVGSTYGIAVTSTPWLRRDKLPAQASDLVQQDGIDYRLRWARAEGCSPTGFLEIHDLQSAEGSLGDEGCSVVRFGGVIDLAGVPGGRYQGNLQVSIFAL